MFDQFPASSLRLFATFLLLHFFVGHSSAFPFQTTELAIRQTSNESPLDTRSLIKRSSCVKSSRAIWECDGDFPVLTRRMDCWGIVGQKPSVFYTEFPVNLIKAK